MPNPPDQLPRDDTVPEAIHEFLARFSTERKCAAFLRRWKYPDGYRCARCSRRRRWWLGARRLDECRKCGYQSSVTAGTVMHGSRKPLRMWFTAIYLFVVSKRGISAAELGRQLGVSYPTAWTWLHKLRSALGERSVAMLEGVVEMDETYQVGVRPGSGGGRPAVSAKASLILGAIETPIDRRGFGRVRLATAPNARAATLRAFATQSISPDAYLIVDGYRSYAGALVDFAHERIAMCKSGLMAHEIQPGIHRVFSLLDRVLKGTYHGAARAKHMRSYLEEFAFRFNRRMSKSRALLFQRVLSAATRSRPPTYRDIVRRTPFELPERS